MATIQGVYVALFGRPADPTGLTYFNSVTKNGADLNGIGDLASTQEYKDRFAGQNNTQIVNSIYQSLFGRDAEAAGLTFFVNALNTGALNIKNIAIAILDGAQGSDKTTVTNKVAAADLYTKSLDTATEIGSYQGNAAAAQGRAFLSGVTTTVPTQAAVDAAITAMVGAGAAGATVSLTAGNDTLSLTAGLGTPAVFTTDKNDTINATTAGFWSPVNDKIDGGLGVDTLNATITGLVTGDAVPANNTGVVAVDALKNVEILNLTGATTANLVDVANAAQLQQVWNSASTVALTVGGIAASTTLGLKGTIGAATTFNFADTAGTNTANVAFDGANSAANAVNIAATEIVNITNSGASVVNNLVLNAGQTVSVAGSGSLTLGINSATVDTVNASSFGGNLTYNASANTAIKAVTGGAGNDALTISTVHANDVKIDAGAGNDTINVLSNGAATKAIVLTGGAGADQFVFGSGVGNVAAVDTAANLVKTLITISDFDKSADAIKVTINAAAATPRDTLLAAEATDIAGQSDILAAAQKAASYTDLHKASVFTFGSDTYIFVNNTDAVAGTPSLDAGDALIKVTGIAAADLTATNFALS